MKGGLIHTLYISSFKILNLLDFGHLSFTSRYSAHGCRNNAYNFRINRRFFGWRERFANLFRDIFINQSNNEPTN